MLHDGRYSTLTACDNDDDNNNNDPKKPSAEKFIGKWEQVEFYEKKDGQWVQEKDTVRAPLFFIMRNDSTMIREKTDTTGQTRLQCGKWHVDSENNTLTMNTVTFPLISISDNRFEITYGKAVDSETGEDKFGEFRFVYSRITDPQKTLAEKLIGKWKYTGTFIKQNGQWVPTSFNAPDEGYSEYKEDGTITTISVVDGVESSGTAPWSINNQTGEMHIGPADMYSVMTVAFDSETKIAITYTNNFDPGTGEVTVGEYKDEFVRE